MTILKIVELDDFSTDKEKEVESYMNYFIKPDANAALGSELSVKPSRRIKHYIITEEIGGITFIHNVLIIDGQEVFPISTKCRSIYNVYRKIFTESINIFLDRITEERLGMYYTSPFTPFENIEGFFHSEIMTEYSSLDPEDTFPIPENIFTLYEHSVLNTNLNEIMERQINPKLQFYRGFMKNHYTLDNFVSIINDINELRFPDRFTKNKKRYSDVSKINNLCDSLAKLKMCRLPYEDRLCIYNPNLEKLIKRIGIYYPNVVRKVENTTLTGNKFVNLSTEKFLRFCDYYLPDNCEVIYVNNACVKFKVDDEYFDSFWDGYKGILPEMGYEGLLTHKTDPKYLFLISHLLQIVRKKTGLDSGRVPLIKIVKSNDTVVSLFVKSKNGNTCYAQWDLTMLLLADPLQYSVYTV